MYVKFSFEEIELVWGGNKFNPIVVLLNIIDSIAQHLNFSAIVSFIN